MDSQFTTDLNQPPPILDYELQNEEGETPSSVMSSSPGNLLIESNNDNHETGTRVIELNLQEFREDDGACSDSSEDETDTQQTQDNNATMTTNSETTSVDRLETSKGNVRERRKDFLPDVQRWAVYRALLEKSHIGKLKKNTKKEVQEMFNVKNLRTVQRIWKHQKRAPPDIDVNVSSSKAKNCGRKRVAVDLSRIQEIELHQRTT